MWIEKNTHSTNTNNNKIELSLSAIMFFSPLIQNLIKKNKNITNKDKNFIKSFIKLGYFNIFLLLINIGLQIGFYLSNLFIFDTAGIVFMITLTLSLVTGSIYAISGNTIPLLRQSIDENNSEQNNKQENINNIDNKLHNLLNYMPFYNIYLRYKNHNFNNPNPILKESILRWSLFTLILILFQNQTINRIFITILLIKIVALMNDITFWKDTQQKLNQLFTKNPEELRWYITGTLSHLFSKSKLSLQENINTKKEKYSLLYKSQNKQILFEYILFWILSITSIYQWYISNNHLLIIAIFFISARYIIMIVKRNHLPHLPLLKEITGMFFKSKSK